MTITDEMGLGKTIELLACIFAHRKSTSECGNIDNVMEITEDQKFILKRLKRERIECICGAVSESSRYEGLWVQCDICDAWQHGDCVGYSTRGKIPKSREDSKGQGCKDKQTENYRKRMRRKNGFKSVEMEGDHICQLCLELIQATDAPVATGATLIVCPSPILPQWHAEIIRYNSCFCFPDLSFICVDCILSYFCHMVSCSSDFLRKLIIGLKLIRGRTPGIQRTEQLGLLVL